MKDKQIKVSVKEIFFDQLLNGLKTVEGRLATDKYKQLKIGDTLIFNDCLPMTVVGVAKYPTFKEMIEFEGVNQVIPHAQSTQEAVEVYYQFYTKEQEKQHQVVAIKLIKKEII